MARNILQSLRVWRDNQAKIEGVETFRVFPNAVLDALAGALPKTKDEMLAIKGIKDAKYAKYGSALLKIIAEHSFGNTVSAPEVAFPDALSLEHFQGMIPEPAVLSDDPLSVTQFLDGINVELSGMAARVKGEVTSVSERDYWIYFSIKDSEGSMLNCLEIGRAHV